MSVSGEADLLPRWRITPSDITTGFSEGTEYRIEKPVDGGQLFIDDELIAEGDGHWLWAPGFYAGQVRAELVRDDQVVSCYVLDVAPHPDKLGRDIFQGMLDDIWQFDPLLVLGTEPPKSPIGHRDDIVDPWLEYARLRAYGLAFIRALAVIARRPIRALKPNRENVPLQYVRRSDRQTAITSLRNPQLLAALVGETKTSNAVEALPPFDVPVVDDTLDSDANRYIAAVTQAVARRAVRLQKTLEAAVERERQSATRSDLASRWPRRRSFIERTVQLLRLAQNSAPICEVTRPELSAAGLNAVSADPAYSRAYGLGWRIRRSGVEGPPDGEELWICPTWEIYERWCFVQLGTALQALMPEYQWSISRTHGSKAKAALVAVDDEEVCMELLLQPKCPSGDAAPYAGFHSVSGLREPDIVLTRRSGDHASWNVFDAKDRTSRSNVLDAMASAHIYKDALRWNGLRPDYSLLLLPRGGAASWLEQPKFIRENRVGVTELSTDTGPSGPLRLLGMDRKP